jgi:uncharacterized OB-fold protein
VSWVAASGYGSVYSQTTVRIPLSPHLPVPYVVALIQLDEGPRMTMYVIDGKTAIGDPVRIDWLDRDDAPPLPIAVRA